MSSAKIKNSFTKWGIHPHCNEAPEGSKLNAATQTLSTQSFETKRLRENSVLLALGAQRQIISKGCDDSVLCSYRFEALLFSKREKWIEFVFEAELMPYGSRTEASINLTKDSNSTISSMIKIEKDLIGESVNWKIESSFSIKTQDNLPIEIDQEGETVLSLGEEELLNPPFRMEVDDLPDQEEDRVYKELPDPLPELDVDGELLGPSLHDNSIKGAKPELDSPPDLVSKDSLLVKEEWDDEKYSYPPIRSEANLESELATDSSTKDELRRTSKEKFHPLLKECFVRVERLPRELAARYEANKAFKFAEKIKEQIKFASESTRKGSDDTSHLESHMKSVNEKIKPFKCIKCNYSCSLKCNLKNHMKSIHEKLKPFKCIKCNYSCSLKHNLESHMMSVHEKLKPFKCIKCNYSCSLKGTLARHMKSVHEKIKPFMCLKCNYSCSQKFNLKSHVKCVHEKIKPFKCLECNYSCIHKSYLVIHIKSVHEKRKPIKCLECYYSCSQKGHLESHMKSVHDKILPFKCLQCNYSCSQKFHLKSHTESVHLKIKPFKCMKCNYSSSLKSTLATHMKSVHEKLKPFKCLKCNHSFSLKRYLVIHVKSVHEKLKPFKCNECNYSCSLKNTLAMHIKAIHEKLKPFKCIKCNFSFSQKCNLKSHMKSVHDKIKPFKCLECNYSCSRKGSLFRHMRIVHHKMQFYKNFG